MVMASRRFYRVLGETSLELKCLALFGSFLLLVITVSFLAYWYLTEAVVKEQNPQAGKLLADQIMVTTHWAAFETNPDFREVIQNLSKESTSYLNSLADPNDKQKRAWRYIVPGDRDPLCQPRNDLEAQLVKRFLQPRRAAAGTADRDDWDDQWLDSGKYVYYRAIRYNRKCGGICHNLPADVGGNDPMGSSGANLQLAHSGSTPGHPMTDGDLMAVLAVTISDNKTQEAANSAWSLLLAVSIVTAFLAMVAFYVTIRYIVARPLKHLRDVSDTISRGNIAMRADIHTGDEFELLGVAFNRMLGHLVTIQDELRHVNVDLDSKVDELAQLNMQLYEMNRVKSDFLATMSHELRTPLNSILGFSEVLGSINALDDKQKRYVQNIQKSGRMLLEMINNILDLAKIESGKMDIRLTDFSIEQVVHAQCDMARPLTEKKNIDLDIAVQADLPPLYQDQSRVQQILNNLLSNAIKFTPEGGRILVSAEQSEAEELLLRVADTGVGIAEEDQQIIFEKFRQGGTALPGGDAMTREYSGTGLGLSIVKELCKLLEGEVSVESELGAGSTFTVCLPWRLKKQPRLDSPLASGFEEFSKPWLDRKRTERLTSDGPAALPPPKP